MTSGFTKSAIGRSAVWSILNQSFGQILVLLVFLVTARFVSKEAFGVMALCLMVVEAFRQIAIESIGLSITAKKDPSDQDYNACFIAIAISGVLSAVLIFIFADALASFLKDPEIGNGLRWTSLLLLTTGLSKTHEVWLAKHLQFKVLALRSIVSIFIGGGVGIAMATRGFGLLSLIAQQLLTALIGTLTLWMATRWRPRWDTRRDNIRSLILYSRHVSMNAVASFVNTQSDVFFSSYYLGAASTGVYNAAKRIITAVNLMLASGLNSVALPVQASLHGDQAASARVFLKSTALTSLLTAPLFVGIAALSNEVIAVSLGVKWLDAAPVLSILTITAYLFTINLYSGNVVLVYNKPQWLTLLGVINAIANVAMLLIFARYGLLALAWAYTLKTIVLFPFSIWLAVKLLKVKPHTYFTSLLPTLLAAAIMGASLIGLKAWLGEWNAWQRLLLLIPLGMLIYALSMSVLQKHLLAEFFSVVSHTLFKSSADAPQHYVWLPKIGGHVHGGTKAFKDVNTILINAGWKTFYTNSDGTPLQKMKSLLQSGRQLLSLSRENIFFLQLPQYGFVKRCLSYVILRRFRTIVLLHDIDKLRKVDGGTSEKLVRYAASVISTGKLHTFLPALAGAVRMVQLEAWDYLLNPKCEVRVVQNGQVIYAGSMGAVKSPGIFRAEVTRMPLVLYGTMDQSEQKHGGDIYKGPFDPDDPAINIEVSWGLVWEGGREKHNALIGNDYEKINQPHKLSLYLACGIPVIVWRGAHIATYVTEKQCGIVIDSLSEIESAIAKVTAAEFERYRGNARAIGRGLREGAALKSALAKLDLPCVWHPVERPHAAA